MVDLASTELSRRTVLAGLAASALASPAAAQCPVPATYRALAKAVWAWHVTAADLPALRDEALRGAGLELVALVGQAEWVRRPDAVPPAIASILQLQARGGLFQAVQLDARRRR
jgi:hypothetical protein